MPSLHSVNASKLVGCLRQNVYCRYLFQRVYGYFIVSVARRQLESSSSVFFLVSLTLMMRDRAAYKLYRQSGSGITAAASCIHRCWATQMQTGRPSLTV